MSRFSREQRIDQIAFPIDGTGEGTPLSIHFDGRFVYIPGRSCLPTSLRPQLLGNTGSEACFPIPDWFMCERNAALYKHFSEITQTQRVAQSPEHNEKNKIGGICEKVERGCWSVHEKYVGTMGRRREQSQVPFSSLASWSWILRTRDNSLVSASLLNLLSGVG